MRQAADLASTLGDAGYEIAVSCNVYLGFLLPFIGECEEARQRFELAQVACEKQGDDLHLGALIQNRASLWVALNDPARFL